MAKKTARRTRPNHFRVLSLDGGGIRGIVTAIWLQRLEEELGQQKLQESFDLVAGTSTGSILACAIGLGVPAAEIVDLYREHGREIFPSTGHRIWNRALRFFDQGASAPKYSAHGLEQVLRRVFGDRRFGELEMKPTLVTSYDTLGRTPIVFKNTRDYYAELPVWEVVKASCSAPTYFPAHIMSLRGVNVPLIDGGVVANNPTACALAEAVRINRAHSTRGYQLDDVVVASFGTGELTRPITASQAQEWGVLEWAVPMIGVLFDGAGDATDYVARQILGADRYFRFQARLERGYDDMDNADRTNIEALVHLAHGYLDTPEASKKMRDLVAAL